VVPTRAGGLAPAVCFLSATGEWLPGGAAWHWWALVTNDSERSADGLESWHRDKANVENRIKEANEPRK
jgi:hypothetical protein